LKQVNQCSYDTHRSLVCHATENIHTPRARQRFGANHYTLVHQKLRVNHVTLVSQAYLETHIKYAN